MEPVCLPEKYEILGELGVGGMGLVYHARDRVLDREVALKVLNAQFADNTHFARRFLTEARAVASLNHPNIVQIYEFGETGNGHFLAMELVRGNTLKIELKKAGRFTENQTIDLILQACQALAVAHRAGIIHRDVKPENIMFTETGAFKLVDLGLAKSLDEESGNNTMTGQSLGTPHFISPEQIKGARTIDARADIYSLGATMYNLATGSVPFDGTSGAHIMSRHLNDPLPDPRLVVPNLTVSFCRVLGRMMAKDPDDRYQDMGSLENDLLVLQQGGTPEATVAVPSALQATIFTSSPELETRSQAMTWDETSLDRVTKRLAKYIGPLAKVLVRKAADRAASWDELTLELSRNIPSSKNREAFILTCERIGAGGGSTVVPWSDSGFGSRSGSEAEVDPSFLTLPLKPVSRSSFSLDEPQMTRVVKLLADKIGPVARMLIKKEMKKASSLAELTTTLARSIPNEADRRSFLDAMNQ